MARLPWFRFYTEARTDRKLDTLKDDEFRVWNNLMCYAAEQTGKRGFIPPEYVETLAIECAHGDQELLDRTMSRLVTLRIAESRDGEGVLITHFEERQYDKPSDMPGATQARKQRERELSRDVTPCHAESPLEQSRAEDKKRLWPSCFNDNDIETVENLARSKAATDEDIAEIGAVLSSRCLPDCRQIHAPCGREFAIDRLTRLNVLSAAITAMKADS